MAKIYGVHMRIHVSVNSAALFQSHQPNYTQGANERYLFIGGQQRLHASLTTAIAYLYRYFFVFDSEVDHYLLTKIHKSL